MVNAVSNYNEWIASLNARGIKTTSLGSNEANFSDYTNALSDSLKQEIAASFDTDADYDLQAKLASVLRGNLIQSTDMKNALAGTGISYSVQYVKTSYIVDNKKGGSYMNNKNATNGSIAVYTFSDGKGGEIKIADANGNGALESEELFMNELLSGVVADISAGGMDENGKNKIQDNNKERMSQLLADLNNYLTEEQRRLAEQNAQLLADLQASNTTVVDAEDEQAEKPENEAEIGKGNKPAGDDDIKREVKNLIYEKCPGITTVTADRLISKAVQIADGDIDNIEDAVDEVLDELEEAA